MNKGIQLGLGVESNNSKESNKFNSFLKNTKKIIAFTLAETLIVMGIIGVVAALTIPNLNASTHEAEKVAKLKKEYAVLNEALNRATAVYGPIGTWFVNDKDDQTKMKRLADRVTEFLKIRSPLTCTTYKYGACSVSLADGTVLNFYTFSGGEDPTRYLPEPNRMFANLYVNIDGKSEKPGINYFDFSITDKGVIPNGFASKEDCKARSRYDYCDDLISDYVGEISGNFEEAISDNLVYEVTWWVINMGNMDYLHCNDLNWTTKTSCK